MAEDTITRQSMLTAYAEQTLLAAISCSSRADEDTLVDLIIDLHNSDEIDFLEACRSDQLEALSDVPFFRFQHVFCRTLPNLNSTVSDAVDTSIIVYEKGGTDFAAARPPRDSCIKWLQHSTQRVEQGLSLIKTDSNKKIETVRLVLLAGAQHDINRFAKEAIDLSYHTQLNVRVGAISALGIMPFTIRDRLDDTLTRLDDIINTSTSADERAIATGSRVSLIKYRNSESVAAVERIVLKSRNDPTPVMRYEIAKCLRGYRRHFTERMIDASFAVLHQTDARESQTIAIVDSILYECDLDHDRHRVLDLLQALISHGEHAVDLEQLRYFRDKLREVNALRAWYVVSLLLTGKSQLCLVAERLSLDSGPLDLGIDLTPFTLGASVVLYLARKIIGYCSPNVRGSASLLLSCLRTSLSAEDRATLESLIFNWVLINHPNAIQHFKGDLPCGDVAQTSVATLARRIADYSDGLRKYGPCPAFSPSEASRSIQGERYQAEVAGAMSEALRGSILSVIPQVGVLYGTGAISYVYAGADDDPQRREVPFRTFRHEIEIPGLSVLDPIGLKFALYCFRSERPPP